jgi:hypothetical protein
MASRGTGIQSAIFANNPVIRMLRTGLLPACFIGMMTDVSAQDPGAIDVLGRKPALTFYFKPLNTLL